MECLNIDFIGPYPNKSYVLVIVDTFTRWVELFYSAAATAKIAAYHLLHTLEDLALLLNFYRIEDHTL
jgi:hypothetical protein